LSSQPQRQVELSGSWWISRRGKSAGSGVRFGVCFAVGAGVLGRACLKLGL
jgi:hypothetical protein